MNWAIPIAWNFQEFYNHALAASPANVVGSAERRVTKVNEMAAGQYLSLDKTIDKHSFNFMFLVYGEKYQSYQTRARPIPLSLLEALGYSALELGTVSNH